MGWFGEFTFRQKETSGRSPFPAAQRRFQGDFNNEFTPIHPLPYFVRHAVVKNKHILVQGLRLCFGPAEYAGRAKHEISILPRAVGTAAEGERT